MHPFMCFFVLSIHGFLYSSFLLKIHVMVLASFFFSFSLGQPQAPLTRRIQKWKKWPQQAKAIVPEKRLGAVWQSFFPIKFALLRSPVSRTAKKQPPKQQRSALARMEEKWVGGCL
jgi:hypothetical protein